MTSTNDTSTVIPIYIMNVHPIMIDDELIWDIYYLTSSSKSLHCLRVYNIYLSFMVARLPGLNLSQFQRYMSQYTESLHTEIRTDLTDASYFNFNRNREYMEIFSKDPRKLNNIYNQLNKSLRSLYKRIEPNKLSSDDELFYRNTETPFRYTSTTTSITNSVYNLSTKYNIPLIGGAQLDTSLLSNKFPHEHEPMLDNVSGLNAQSIGSNKWNYQTVNSMISRAIVKDDNVDFRNNMQVLSYDIETYNPDGDLNPHIDSYYIFAIGIGIFNLNDPMPERRICLISKQFDNDPVNVDSNMKLQHKFGKMFGNKCCHVYGEYNDQTNDIINSMVDDQTNSDVNSHTDGQTNSQIIGQTNSSVNLPINHPNNSGVKHHQKLCSDYTTYIFAHDEEQLLKLFIEVIHAYKPQVITGFNTFGFDDNYVYVRMQKHNLTNDFLQVYTYYDISSDDAELPKQSWFKPFMPIFKQFDLKIDNEPRHDNQSVRSWLVLNVDVYKLMLKEDPKRFTQYGRGNLDTMLEVYEIKNPYTKQPLSKTGLKIHEMYRRWENNENIYSIALYCCQDAWITGTLLITRAKLSDLIEMSIISSTMFADSIYRADGTRVANSILNYAYSENFALMDTPFTDRTEVVKNKSIPTLGGKTYDHRTIVGGAVKNIHAGRQWFVVALDYSAMYPANKEASNIDSSSRVDDDIINNPNKYNVEIVRKLDINDMYGQREIYYIKKH